MPDDYSDDDFYGSDDDGRNSVPIGSMRALALAPTDVTRRSAAGGRSISSQQPLNTVAVPSGMVSTSSLTQEEILARVIALEKALYKSQRECDALKTRNTELEENCMTMHNDKRRKRQDKESGVSNMQLQTEKSPQEVRITIAGKKFAVLCSPWLSQHFPDQLTAECPDVNPLDFHQRYHDDESEELALIAEAWGIIGAEPVLLPGLRSGLDPELIEKFSTAVSYEKSKFVNASTQNIHLIFEDLQLPLSTFKTLQARRNYAALRALGPEDADDVYCRVLFPLRLRSSPSLEEAGHLLFRSERIIMVLQGALFGVSAVGSNTTRRAGNVKANIWRVKEATPGMIAFAATVLVFLTSGDEYFKPPDKGVPVTWDYARFFETYLKMLIKNLHSAVVQELFRWINKEVFGHAGGSDFQSAESSQPDTHTAVRNRAIAAAFGSAPSSTDPTPSPHTASLSHDADTIPHDPVSAATQAFVSSDCTIPIVPSCRATYQSPAPAPFTSTTPSSAHTSPITTDTHRIPDQLTAASPQETLSPSPLLVPASSLDASVTPSAPAAKAKKKRGSGTTIRERTRASTRINSPDTEACYLTCAMVLHLLPNLFVVDQAPYAYMTYI
ncbi:hypothetical protein BDY19DRAFT_997873 [Irpex rosettiformis]|uniref:Uncharacterized protein n=1 Tax=Irpex rosettiformis TaxID=378272 RepID=A0ACB8TQF8_9APHY|nr:hypothetical protein BDY19DRAFT_997873 [Irpex rosettiformis]